MHPLEIIDTAIKKMHRHDPMRFQWSVYETEWYDGFKTRHYKIVIFNTSQVPEFILECVGLEENGYKSWLDRKYQLAAEMLTMISMDSFAKRYLPKNTKSDG